MLNWEFVEHTNLVSLGLMSRLPARRGGYLGSCFYSIYCGLSTVDLKFISRKSTSPQIGKKQVGSGSD